MAEDLRALARSLARDVRAAAEESVRSGRPTAQALRDAVRGIVGDSSQAARDGGARYYRRYRHCGPRRAWIPPQGPYAGAPRASYGSTPPPWAPRAPRAGSPGAPWVGSPRTPWPQARRPPLPPVRRRWDAATVAGLLVVVFGAAWLLGALHILNVPMEGVLAVGSMLFGAAVIVTARTDWSMSRRSWPVWLGGGLVVALVATSASLGVGGALDHVSFGSMDRNVSGGDTAYGGLGTLTVQASSVPPGRGFAVKSEMGQTSIETRQDSPLVVHAGVLGGQICVDGEEVASGVGASVNGRYGQGPGAPVTVTVHQLFGQVLIDGRGCARP